MGKRDSREEDNAMTRDDQARFEVSARRYIEDVMSIQGGSNGIPPEDVEKAIQEVAKVSKRHAQAMARYQASQQKRHQF